MYDVDSWPGRTVGPEMMDFFNFLRTLLIFCITTCQQWRLLKNELVHLGIFDVKSMGYTKKRMTE